MDSDIVSSSDPLASDSGREQIPLTLNVAATIVTAKRKDPKSHSSSRHTFASVSRFLPYTFAFLATVACAVWLMGFFESDLKQYFMIALECLLVIVSLLGLYCTFKYGVIQDQINQMAEENKSYKDKNEELMRNRMQLGSDISLMDKSINELKRDGQVLEQEAEKFEHLISELKKVAGDDESVLKLIKKASKAFQSIKKWILENDRAYLISTYYRCSIQDNDDNMNEEEYGKFLQCLTKKQREKFMNLPSFKELANEDGQIDMPTFLKLIEHVRTDIDENISFL